MQTKIYTCGAKSPIVGTDLVQKQLRLAREYQNALVACERRLRDVEKRVVASRVPVECARYDAALAALQTVEQVARNARASGEAPKRGLAPNTSDIEVAKHVFHEAQRALWIAEKKVRTNLEVKTEIANLWIIAAAARRALRSEAVKNGLYWGTYLLVEAAMDAAAKKTRKEHSLPHFRDRPSQSAFWIGGRVGVQLQGGLPVPDALTCTDTRLRIEVLDDAEWFRRRGKGNLGNDGKSRPVRQPGSSRSKTGRRNMRFGAGYQRAIAHFRVGSNGRLPIFAEIPILLDRPLPVDGVIKWAWIFAREIGPRIEWSVQLTVVLPDVVANDAPAERVALNLGWRRLPNGEIRVGYVVGNDGYEEEIRVPSDVATRIEHADSIVSIIDRSRDEMIARLCAFAEMEKASEGFCRAVAHAPKWRGRERLLALRSRWGIVPVGEEDELVRALDKWILRDRHLWFWAADERTAIMRRRLQAYREVAARLATRYGEVIITDMIISDFAEQPEAAEGARSEGREQRRQRMIAAPAELRKSVKEAFTSRGRGVCEKKAVDYTRTCDGCGVVASKSDESFRISVRVTCGTCGQVRDQDASHCGFLLASAGMMREDEEAFAATESRVESRQEEAVGGRWQKKRSQKGM